ncbi:hypothetical protein M405DRAFT_930493 [Rhizopogon salebrosus TDB-379]|nr:hypothetical protein M405DRAFT_930493 [Rhizopogon salebrosus TDB-379]
MLISELTLYYFNVIHSLKSASRVPSAVSLFEGPVKDWAKKVVSKSQLKPSASPSARSARQRWPWTIPDEDLSNALREIHSALHTNHRAIEFDVDFDLVKGSMNREHPLTRESRREYAEYLLDGLRFGYEDPGPGSEEQPGAFLSGFILRIFAIHLNAIHGHKRVDALDTMMLGHFETPLR